MHPPEILLIDDELAVLTTLQHALESFSLALAVCLTEAVIEWRNHHSSLKLVITDYNLPDGFGMELARQILEDSEDVRVIILNDDSDGYVCFPKYLSERVFFSKKPVIAREIIKIGRSCIPRSGKL